MASRLLGATPDELNITKAELRQLLKEVYSVGWHAGVRSGVTDDGPCFETENKLRTWRQFLDS
jgi:hypothetical protein